MSLSTIFNAAPNIVEAALPAKLNGTPVDPAKSARPRRAAASRPAPFSIRLSEADRARLALEAAGAPLGAYIKSKILGTMPLERKGRKVLSIQDREALAQALALLGRSHLSNNLNKIAHAVHVGVLPFTPETEAELRAAVGDVRELRRLFMTALGFKLEDRP